MRSRRVATSSSVQSGRWNVVSGNGRPFVVGGGLPHPPAYGGDSARPGRYRILTWRVQLGWSRDRDRGSAAPRGARDGGGLRGLERRGQRSHGRGRPPDRRLGRPGGRGGGP